jgi:hypothetical protein
MKKFLPLILLIIIELVLFLTNYLPGTYLVGWDTVMPEFNPGLNLRRGLFSLWQEYRGLGVLDGMAHAATLPHTLLIGLLSVFLPQNLLRYVFIHLTHLAGGIGMYLLLMHLMSTFTFKLIHLKCKSIALAGALFYLFNFGIIQLYFAPFEGFAVHFAALPLLTLLTLRQLDSPSRKNGFLLFLTSFFLATQGFVPTVFTAYAILTAFLLLSHSITFRRSGKKNLRTVFLTALLIISAHAFWVVPYIYSAFHTPAVIANTKINQFSSEEIYFRNKAHGTLSSVFTFKGFMIDTLEIDTGTMEDVLIMQQWRNHYSTFFAKSLSLLFICIMLFGIISAIRNKERTLLPFGLSFITAFIFLANNTLPLEQFHTLIRAVFPLLGEAFRFPFTKFMTLFTFCFTLFLSYGLFALFTIPRLSKAGHPATHRKMIQTLMRISLPVIAIIGILFLSLPAFRGHFFSPYLRLKIPDDYFRVARYLQTPGNEGRIALLPAPSFWNWQYRTWGFRGSGFQWHAFEQPTMNRAFDPWSTYNEQFYNELSYSIRTADSTLLKQTLRKYDITHLLLDRYTLDPLTKKPINYAELEAFLISAGAAEKTAEFGNIAVYKTGITGSGISSIPEASVTGVSPQVAFTNTDPFLNDTTRYYTVDTVTPDISYPSPHFIPGNCNPMCSFQRSKRALRSF